MKRVLLAGLFQLILFTCIAQSSNYRVTYRHCLQTDTSKTLVDTIGLEAVLTGNAESSNYTFARMTPEREAAITEAARKNQVPVYDKNNPTQRYTVKLSGIGIPFDSVGNMLFWNKKKDSLFVREKMIHEYVLTREKRPEIKWQILNESRRIGEYQCSKAITKFRGRKYTAWFAPELPIKEGPWKFKGLPGLIMSMEDEDQQVKIYATKVELSSNDPVPGYNTSGKAVSLSEYVNLFHEETSKLVATMSADIARQIRLPNRSYFSQTEFKPPSPKTKYYRIEKRI